MTRTACTCGAAKSRLHHQIIAQFPGLYASVYTRNSLVYVCVRAVYKIISNRTAQFENGDTHTHTGTGLRAAAHTAGL